VNLRNLLSYESVSLFIHMVQKLVIGFVDSQEGNCS